MGSLALVPNDCASLKPIIAKLMPACVLKLRTFVNLILRFHVGYTPTGQLDGWRASAHGGCHGPRRVPIPRAVRTTDSKLRAPSPMSRPVHPINAPNQHGAVGYMIERLEGRLPWQCDISRANNLELASKSVAYADELNRLTRTSVLADQAAVHTLLLEALEDRIIARFRGLYANEGIEVSNRNPLLDWKSFEFTTIDNKLAKIAKKQTNGAPMPFNPDIRKEFSTLLVEAGIEALEQRDLAKYPRQPQRIPGIRYCGLEK